MILERAKTIECDFCAHACKIVEGKTGICGRRYNDGSGIVTLDYGYILPPSLDPIEKKPLYHVKPGASCFSYAMPGCNFRCSFCQNYSLSQIRRELPPGFVEYPSKSLVDSALQSKSSCIAATYSEPLVWGDFVEAVSKEAKDQGLITCMVSNGFFTQKSRERLCGSIDAFNIDLKGDEEFYKTHCHGHWGPVIESITDISSRSNHIEVTTMFISTIHSNEDIVNLAKSLEEADIKVWHISKFHPDYKMMDRPGTQNSELIDLYKRIRDTVTIPYIYMGNIAKIDGIEEAFDTNCYYCGNKLIDRNYRSARVEKAFDGTCSRCGNEIYGIF